MKSIVAALIFCIFSLGACNHTKPTNDTGTVRVNSVPSEKTVLLSFVCKHEEIIMKLAYFDSQSKQLAAQYFFLNLMAEECVKFDNPSKFVIDEVVTEYKDFENDSIVVLKVKKEDTVGYVLVLKDNLVKGVI
tara:strand:- start:189 stop:587 length:399 start_codon:yes stop_codon:yes gene_type:complete